MLKRKGGEKVICITSGSKRGEAGADHRKRKTGKTGREVRETKNKKKKKGGGGGTGGPPPAALEEKTCRGRGPGV